MELAGRVAVITGGGDGIGAALARAFAAEGAAHVAVADLNGQAADAVAAEIGGSSFQLDAADAAAVSAMTESVMRQHGPIDLLCANAGIATAGDVDSEGDTWQRAWNVNVMSQVHAARAVLPSMLARGAGYLMLTSSAAGLTTSLDSAPYAVTKHASIALAEWLAITYGDRGIAVSCLAPQFVDTAMGRSAMTTPAASAWVAQIMIDPADVAASVIAGLRAESFLILPHPEVAGYFQNKAAGYDRWIGGMRKLRADFEE
ncbi:MAG: SDR family oxidoreductase [Acidimicrobiia bacterium]|nr:SDR family oxidoreductase [Acidimicrobiia bacterium]